MDALTRYEGPAAALTKIATGRRAGTLSLYQQGRDLEDALATVQDQASAAELVDGTIGCEAAAEMAASIGTITGSVTAALLPIKVVVAAILIDTENDDPVTAYTQILAWAMNLAGREDWDVTTTNADDDGEESLLDREVGGYTFRDLLIAAAWETWGQEDLVEDEQVVEGDLVSPDSWLLIGLDPTEAEERLRDLLENDGLPRFGFDEVETARQRLRQKRVEAEAQAAATVAANEIKI